MNLSLNALPVNAFDVVLLVVLVLGVYQGRKNGMSQELLNVAQWLVLVLVCALVYSPLGQQLAAASPFSLLASFLMVYIAVALVILVLFGFLKRSLGGKLLGSDLFGRSEYYLGMGSGLVRFACILIAFLALLNSRYFSPAEVQAMVNFQNDVYGSNFFPGWHSAQEAVFEKSLTGPIIRDYLGFLLIHPTPAEDKQIHQKEANWQQ